MEEIENKGIVLTEEALNHIGQTAKWAQFLAIMGFVFTALIVVAGLFMGTVMSTLGQLGGNEMAKFPMMGLSFLYVVLGGLYFVPSWFLYKFSTETRTALQGNDERSLTEGLSNLRRTFKFLGIMTIAIIGLYVLIIVGVVIGAAVGAAF